MMRDVGGRAALKFVIAASLIAMLAAMSSPAFKNSPLANTRVGKLQRLLPDILDKAAHALRGR